MLEDLRYALRSILRERQFSLAVIVTLALAIGANLAIFSTLYGTVFRPLPYPEPDRLAVVWAQWRQPKIPRVSHTGGDVRVYQEENTTFEEIAAIGSVRQNLTGGERPEQVQVGWVSRNFFRTLQITPVLGNDLGPDEPAGSLLLGHSFWQRSFGGRPDVIGRALTKESET